MYLQLAEVDLAEPLSLQWMVVTFGMLRMQKFFQDRDLEGREGGWRVGRGKNSGRPPAKPPAGVAIRHVQWRCELTVVILRTHGLA